MKKDNNYKKVENFIKKHELLTEQSISLIASENQLSEPLKNALTSDLGNRVAEGWLGERLFPGIKYYDEIEKIGQETIAKMFHADFVDIRPISGTMANMIVYNAFLKPGDKIASISTSSGGHISMSGATPKRIFNLEVINLPFDCARYNIDLNKAIEEINKQRPKLVILGGSVILFKQPLKEIAEVCKNLGIILVFDAAHVAGLIGAGCYPNPFEDGADIVTMTTCKTIPGPQHAFILAREKYAESIKRSAFPGFLSGHHLHETVASILAMLEFKQFGKKYCNQVIRNAKKLAEVLYEFGFKVISCNGEFTETHMLLIDMADLMDSDKAEKLLEKGNIFTNKNLLAWDTSFKNPSGLRLGTPEVTRIGMKEKEMEKIGLMIAELLFQKKDPEIIKNEVIKLRKSFPNIKYCY